ncbi:alkaline shock response membrane anchor protein AmaP [Amycolatopsis anabasis]|uniref:alkaline shock response membrane anchor protein AmaP n=1 Tax=Amycolatopsis anabasis TaxID=1840409 RepID=UPI00131D6257|nr:alkaline shock response membrane anchor protein AmaP [Amycolatopsis anabasis]
MTNANRPARLNRSLLALTGIVLLAGGGFALATHFGALRVLDPAASLLPGGMLPAWAYYAAAAVAVLLGLLCLRWLAAQAFRRPKSGTWRLEREPALGSTRLDAAIAVKPLVGEVEDYPGVHAVTATLAGERDRPELHLVVGAERGAALGELRGRIAGEAVPRLRRALDLDALPAVVEFRLTRKSGARIR